MSSNGEKTSPDRSQYAFNITIAAVAGQVGCLTALIVIVALVAGLWLDSQFDTRPMFTVGLMIVSVPLTLVVMFWVVRKATRHMRTNDNQKSKTPEEEEYSSGETDKETNSGNS